jgi:D-tyrosyl-tRNA(Tyr) deacylase
MRAVVQRVRRGSVSVDGQVIGQTGPGFVILLGIGPEDTEEKAKTLAYKIAHLRVFDDGEGKMNRSVLDINGSALVVSQFTLYADTRKGHRPSFVFAAPPDMARVMVDRFVELLRAEGVPVETGEFGAHMLVDIENDGPVTIPYEL